MPTPNKQESKKNFLKRCIPQVINEGKKQDQAIAICNSLWEQSKKKAKGHVELGKDDEFLI